MLEEFREAVALLFGNDSELRTIIFVTLKMSFFSTCIACILGIPLGLFIGKRNFIGKGFVRRLVNTLMGLPPVVGGLIVFRLLSRSGPFGEYRLLYTIQAMVIAQVVLITPIVTGLTIPLAERITYRIQETATGIGISPIKQLYLLFYECRKPLISVILTGFGRSIAEVGAVSLVGGNVQFKTRVMTTAIMLETNRGNFEFALALGIVLLLISFVVNSFVAFLQDNKRERNGRSI